jgi:hypothetical protein
MIDICDHSQQKSTRGPSSIRPCARVGVPEALRTAGRVSGTSWYKGFNGATPDPAPALESVFASSEGDKGCW